VKKFKKWLVESKNFDLDKVLDENLLQRVKSLFTGQSSTPPTAQAAQQGAQSAPPPPPQAGTGQAPQAGAATTPDGSTSTPATPQPGGGQPPQQAGQNAGGQQQQFGDGQRVEAQASFIVGKKSLTFKRPNGGFFAIDLTPEQMQQLQYGFM